jgi:hypothetical protein
VVGFASISASCFAEDFLVRQDGSQLTQEVHNTDPKTLAVLYWEMHLYKKDGSRDWGMCNDKTYEGLMRDLTSGQRFDRIWAKATNTDIESFDNYQHPGPPIAVLKKPEAIKSDLRMAAETVQKIRDLNSRYKEAVEAWNVLTGNWEKIEVNDSAAMQNVGKVIGEYTDNFRDVFKKMMRLKGFLNESNDIAGLESALASFDGSLSETEASAKKATDALAGVSDESGTQSGTQSATEEQDPGDMQNAIASYTNDINLIKKSLAYTRSRGDRNGTALLEKRLQFDEEQLEEAKASQRRHDALQRKALQEAGSAE